VASPGRSTTVLVEGESDRVALESLARRSGLDLGAAGVAVVGMGGATSVGRFLAPRAPAGDDHRLLVLCDAAEVSFVTRAVERAGLDGAVGLHVCEADLEDELVRCLGTGAVLDVIEAAGELASFRLLQRQPALRDRPLTAQLHRFFAGRSGQDHLRAPARRGASPRFRATAPGGPARLVVRTAQPAP
jgi:hypothetical protein